MQKENEDCLVMNLWPETGKRLNLSRPTVYAYARQGIIPALRLGNRWVVPKAALEKMLAEAGQAK